LLPPPRKIPLETSETYSFFPPSPFLPAPHGALISGSLALPLCTFIAIKFPGHKTPGLSPIIFPQEDFPGGFYPLLPSRLNTNRRQFPPPPSFPPECLNSFPSFLQTLKLHFFHFLFPFIALMQSPIYAFFFFPKRRPETPRFFTSCTFPFIFDLFPIRSPSFSSRPVFTPFYSLRVPLGGPLFVPLTENHSPE